MCHNLHMKITIFMYKGFNSIILFLINFNKYYNYRDTHLLKEEYSCSSCQRINGQVVNVPLRIIYEFSQLLFNIKL